LAALCNLGEGLDEAMNRIDRGGCVFK